MKGTITKISLKQDDVQIEIRIPNIPETASLQLGPVIIEQSSYRQKHLITEKEA